MEQGHPNCQEFDTLIRLKISKKKGRGAVVIILQLLNYSQRQFGKLLYYVIAVSLGVRSVMVLLVANELYNCLGLRCLKSNTTGHPCLG